MRMNRGVVAELGPVEAGRGHGSRRMQQVDHVATVSGRRCRLGGPLLLMPAGGEVHRRRGEERWRSPCSLRLPRTAAEIAEAVGSALATVAELLTRIADAGSSWRRGLADPLRTACPGRRDPSELLHVDVDQLAGASSLIAAVQVSQAEPPRAPIPHPVRYPGQRLRVVHVPSAYGDLLPRSRSATVGARAITSSFFAASSVRFATTCGMRGAVTSRPCNAHSLAVAGDPLARGAIR